MAKLEAVLFDLDTTLINTKCLEDYRANRLFAAIPDSLIAKTVCYKPVVGLLKKLKEQGVKTGIVTNSPRRYAERLLDHHQIADLFDVLVTYTEVQSIGKKPSPMGINRAIENLGISKKKRVVYVGDEFTDVEAAYRAGVIPVVPTWGSSEAVRTPPAAELSSAALLAMAGNIEEYLLFAERCAYNKGTDFDREAARFLPLDEDANVVTIRKKLKAFCLGRYFSQKNEVTASLHDSHPLSLEIAKKDKIKDYVPPAWMASMLLKVVNSAHLFLFEDKIKFDIVTVIPSKPGKVQRLESLLERMRSLARQANIEIDFRSDLLYFDDGAAKSLRGMRAAERMAQQDNHLHARIKNLIGKRVLVIDDVITTGATLGRAIKLMEMLGSQSVYGLGVAKTVSINTEARPCPSCGREMLIGKNRASGERFWSCSGYHDNQVCKATLPFDYGSCPLCGKPLKLKTNSKDNTKFLGCTGYFDSPKCKFTKTYQ